MNFKKEEYKKIAQKIFSIDSPSGFTNEITEVLKKWLEEMDYTYTISNNGTIKVSIKGESSKKKIALSAHIDTLGLMVRSIKSDGKLALTKIGSPLIPSLDGEYVRIKTRKNNIYEGTILSLSPSVHVYEDAEKLPRDIDHMEVRIDEKVFTENDVRKLGIENGDYVCIHPKFEITDKGFLKSRFIDDKACASLLLYLLKDKKEMKISFAYDTDIYFTCYEEIGHGASSIEPMDEFVVLDMGCIGKDLAGNEYSVSICAKDSSGPYDYELITKMIQIAQENHLSYAVDIFPYYASDIRSAREAGLDFKGALIGPGVHASHGMERTHMEAIENTYRLLLGYLTKK